MSVERSGRRAEERRGADGSGVARQVRQGLAERGGDWRGNAGEERDGREWRGLTRHGQAGMDWHGGVRQGKAERGVVWQARIDEPSLVPARSGRARQVRQGVARLLLVRRGTAGWARRDAFSSGVAGTAGYVGERHASVRSGKAG